MLPRFAPLVRNFGTSLVRKSAHGGGGIAGSNLPFSIENKVKLTVLFALFFGSGMALPFLVVRHSILK